MHRRTNGMQQYRWQSLRSEVQLWYERQQLAVLELPVLDIDATFGTSHSAPRASTLIIKLRYEARVAFMLLVTPARCRANLTAIRKTLGASTAWISTLGEIQSLTRSVPGCVPAFGSMFGLPVILDTQLRRSHELFAPSGRPGHAVRIPIDDFVRVERPRLIDVDRRVLHDGDEVFDVNPSIPRH